MLVENESDKRSPLGLKKELEDVVYYIAGFSYVYRSRTERGSIDPSGSAESLLVAKPALLQDETAFGGIRNAAGLPESASFSI